jgi:hypothetical protein
MRSLQIDQCHTNADCVHWGLDSTSDGCWDCYAYAGTSEYTEALKSIASVSCSAFRAKGCHVNVTSCGAPERIRVVWTCANAKCVSGFSTLDAALAEDDGGARDE